MLDVDYRAAQFFAGPYSLMLGFIARVADATIATPGEELGASSRSRVPSSMRC